jgi:N-hydroxyarylamine O-acetyltransferase
MVARTGEGWRRTLNNGSFAIHRIGYDSERRQVADVQELLGVLEGEFGIRVPVHATLMRTLEHLIQPQ